MSLAVLFLSLLLQTGWAHSSTVLVTGGAGFIGYHTALKLVEKESAQVLVLDNFSKDYDVDLKKKRANQLKEKGVTIYEGSVGDPHIVEYIFRHHPDLTGVVHCAAFTNIEANNDDHLKSVTGNLETLVPVLDEIRKHKGSSVRLVYLSSADVYSSGNSLPFSTSSKLLLPQHMLAAMKMGGESLITGYAEEHKLSAVSLRLFSVYGTWDHPGTYIYNIATVLHENKPIEIPYDSGDKALTRDFVYIDDVVDAILLSLKYTSSQDGGHTVFNVGTGVGTPLNTVAELLKSEMGKSSDISKVAVPSYETPAVYADISDTKSKLGWTPKTLLADGVKKFVEWFKSYKSSAQAATKVSFDSLQGKAFDEYITYKNKAFLKRIGDMRENYTAYAKAHNIPVARFYRHKEFKFFPNVDSGSTRRTVSGSVEQMKEVCRSIDECVAFNAQGGLKGIIDIKSRWRGGSGLYVADIDVCQAGLHNCFGNSTCTYKGPAQFSCGCKEGFGWINGRCVELYIEGRVSQAEADEKLADYIDGRDWVKFLGSKAGQFVVFRNQDEHVGNGELLYYPQAKGNVEELKKACISTYHCLGFSTSGLLKRAIDQPRAWHYSGDSMYLIDVDYCSLDAFRCPPHSRCRKESPARYSC